MKTLYLNIADCIIKMVFYESEYSDEKRRLIDTIINHYQGFVLTSSPRKADYTIRCVDSTTEITFFNKKNGNGYMYFYHKKSPTQYETYYYISIFQVQALLFEILLDWLDRKGGFIMHASGNLVAGKAVLFLGKSGAGKSTITTLLNPRFPTLASDSIIIKKNGTGFYSYQTPFFEKESWVKRKYGKIPLKALYFIHKADDCRLSTIPARETVIKNIIKQILMHRRKENDMVDLIMKFVSKKTQFGDLYFSKNASLLMRMMES